MRARFLLLAVLTTTFAQAQPIPAASVEESLLRATAYLRSVSTKGGYPGIWSATGDKRFGESFNEKAGPNSIWIQPPGTPTVGEVFLAAWKATGKQPFLDAAREVGLALAWAQRPAGGWNHQSDMSRVVLDASTIGRVGTDCTFDDNISQGALTFLIHLDEEVDTPWLTESVQLGLAHLEKAQYPNGGWPQWYPLIGSYHDHATYNDGAINDCIRTALLSWNTYHKPKYLELAKRGGDFIVLSQGKPPQEGWAQQCDKELRPAWARAFEPPGYSSQSTARNIQTLIDLYLETGEEKYLKPIPAALSWLDRSKLSDGVWARLYEVGTNRPIYGDHDRKIHYTLEEISAERQKGYSWRGGYGVLGAAARYRRIADAGRAAALREQNQPPTAAEQRRRMAALASTVGRIVQAQDDQGRWTRREWIYIDDFVANLRTLVDYCSAAALNRPE